MTGLRLSPASPSQGDEVPFSKGLYTRVARVVAYLFIGSALIVVTISSEPTRQPLLYVVLAMGALLMVVGQDLLPMSLLGRWRPAVEAGAVLGFLTLLVMLTGGYASPFFLGYLLLLAGTSLWAQGVGPYVLAIAAIGLYVVGVAVSPDGLPQVAWGQVGFNVVALALTSYVASVIGREQRRAHDAALRLSRFDPLTELHSRSYFGFALEQEILRSARTGRAFSLLMLDLDGLKPVNDRFGHASGDRLLRGIADVIRGGLRVTDIAARYGGDEFIVILPETDAVGAMRVAEKLRRDVAQLALPENGQMIQSTVSIGLVAYPDDGRAAGELLRRADAAMYEAKRRGRDRTVRYGAMGGAKRAVPVAAPPARESQPAPWDAPGPEAPADATTEAAAPVEAVQVAAAAPVATAAEVVDEPTPAPAAPATRERPTRRR